VAHDQIVIVPDVAKEVALRFAYSRPWRSWPLPRRTARHLLIRALNALED
jgi:hypothetical protein